MIATGARDRLSTREDLVPCIEADEADVLVEVATILGTASVCWAWQICPNWQRVKTLVSLKRREMVKVADAQVTLTDLGREWAAAFAKGQS